MPSQKRSVIMRAILIALAASALTVGSASAAEIYIDDDDDYGGVTVYERDVTVVERAYPAAPGTVVEYGPRVYGWTEAAPVNCGRFRYWDGDYCADARFDPPED